MLYVILYVMIYVYVTGHVGIYKHLQDDIIRKLYKEQKCFVKNSVMQGVKGVEW